MIVKISGKLIFMTVAIGGIIATAYFSARNAPEAQKRKEEALQAKRERTGDENAQLTFMETVSAQIKCYIPAIAAGAIAVGGIAGSEVLNEKNVKELKKKYDDFKEMTDKIDGKGSGAIIEKAVEQKKLDAKKSRPWEKPEEFRIVFQGKSILFESTRADVMEAIYEANRYFHERGLLTFNEFLSYLGQDPMGPEGDDRGWDVCIGESLYGYSWIDIGLKECIDEPWITEIYMPVYPHFLDEDDANAELDDSVGKLLSPPNKNKKNS